MKNKSEILETAGVKLTLHEDAVTATYKGKIFVAESIDEMYEKLEPVIDQKINAEHLRSLRMKLPDAYDLKNLSFSQVLQVLEQDAPYTDFVVFKGMFEVDDYEDVLELLGMTCETLVVYGDTQNEKQYHTLIRFK